MRLMLTCSITLVLGVCIAGGCDESDSSPPQVHAPGHEKTVKSQLLEAGAELTQGMPPIEQINMYLNGFHFYADEMGRQVEAHHYCTHLNQDVHQCVIYDSHGPEAKLIGIEYIISERLFKQLPEDEKKYWHSHSYEVKSGTLVMPGVPAPAEKEAMEMLATTYGKTWHTWQVDRGDPLPYGIPQLMMAFTADGQLNPTLLQDRDQRLDVSSTEKKEQRQDIPTPQVQPGANPWQSGQTPQLCEETVEVKR